METSGFSANTGTRNGQRNLSDPRLREARELERRKGETAF